jgi:subtilisin family serine protease
MKHFLKIFSVISLLNVISIGTFAQVPPELNIEYDSDGNPYVKNEMIVKFHPGLVNLSMVDDTSKITGLVSDFVDSLVLQALIDSGYFHQGLADLQIKKIYPWLTSSITSSETRIGTTIEMPKFWSTFLIYWDDVETGVSYQDALDSLNGLYPAVHYAEPNYIFENDALPDDPEFVAGDQPGLVPTSTIPNADINLEPAWDFTVGRDNTRVGIYDSGINWDHDDFSKDGTNRWPYSVASGGFDYVNNWPVNQAWTNADAEGHGTACAGIIGAIRNNDLGVTGIAGGDGSTGKYGVKLISMRTTRKRSSKVSNYANAIVAGATSISSGGYQLDIMNLSNGARGSATTIKDAVRFAYGNSCIIVTSSGNEGDETKQYPASYKDDWVLKVGANDETGDRWSGSTYGNNLDFIAPGTANLYATPDHQSNTLYNKYNFDGTSFAAPHVSGVAALMCSYINSPSSAPNKLAPEDVENLIQRFATDLTFAPNAVGYDIYTGFGRVDAGAVLAGIEMPRYEVRHKSIVFSNSDATLVSTGVRLFLEESKNGIAAGSYIGDVYKVVKTIPIGQPSGRTIIDVWSRNSSSTLYGGAPIFPEANCQIVSWNQTSATMEGYIFHIQTDVNGRNLNKWLPSHGLNGDSRMSLTIYSEDPTANANNLPFDSEFARIVPNPSNGNFSLLFHLKRPEYLTVQILDLSGKVVYTKVIGNSPTGHQEISIDANELCSGLYFCKLSTSSSSFTKKISITK